LRNVFANAASKITNNLSPSAIFRDY